MRTLLLLFLPALLGLLLAGCAAPSPAANETAIIPPAPTAAPTAGVSASPIVAQVESGAPLPTATVNLLPAESPPDGVGAFSTDFSRHSIPYSEILAGGPPKDGIPAIDQPRFVTIDEADSWLQPQEPVVLLALNGEAHAYPIQILMWHEIVNDTVGGVPATVTFCPLCNTAIAFERQYGERLFDFGTTGRLRFSNLIMYDRQTESWWQQATGEAIAGELTGAQLRFLPAAIISWQTFTSGYPDGQVLSRETGFNRTYGRNPYTGYDDVNTAPFLYQGPPTPGALPPTARVLTIEYGGEAVAYPYTVLAEEGVVNDNVGGLPIVVFWAAGTASALDAPDVAGGRDVGAALAFERRLDGQELSFVMRNGQVIDEQSTSSWGLLGVGSAGPLAGRRLTPLVGLNHFWFSWAAFRPETRIYQP